MDAIFVLRGMLGPIKVVETLTTVGHFLFVRHVECSNMVECLSPFLSYPEIQIISSYIEELHTGLHSILLCRCQTTAILMMVCLPYSVERHFSEMMREAHISWPT